MTIETHADESDDGPCTDCDDTGITFQTERRCTCQTPLPEKMGGHAEKILRIVCGYDRSDFNDDEWAEFLAACQALRDEGAQAGAAAMQEAAAKACEDRREDFLSPEYATRPRGSICERFACSECAAAILAIDVAKLGEE